MLSVEASSPALSLSRFFIFLHNLSLGVLERGAGRKRKGGVGGGGGDEFKIRMLSLSVHALLSLLLSLAGLKLLLLGSGQNSYLPGGVRVLTDKAGWCRGG